MSTTASQPLNPLASQTLAAVQEALLTNEAASVVQVIQLIREIASKGHSMPVQQLAELIARDLTTMSKVLRAANTLGYNPEGVEVITITQAINVIGFEKVRNLAISLLLVENAEGKTLAPESREVAGLAVASGLVAQCVTEQLGALDPEQSFVCAALRNYGKLLLTTFLLAEYRRAQQLIPTCGSDAAYRNVFGLTPLELSYEILQSAQFPRPILRCLQAVSPERMSVAAASAEDQLAVLAEFSVKLCELMLEGGASPGHFERGSAHLVATYGRALALSGQDLTQLVKTLDRKLTAFGSVQGVRVFTSPLMKNIGLLASQAQRGTAVTATRDRRAEPAPVESQAKEILLGGLAEVAQLMAATPVDFEKVLDSARRCVQSALQLTHCVVFVKDTGRATLSARVGGGSFIDQVRGQSLLDPTKNDVFKAALTRGDDVLVQNSSDPKIWPSLPDWVRAVGQNKTLLALPIRDEEGTFALILGISELLLPLELAAQFKPQLKVLRSHVAFLRGMG